MRTLKNHPYANAHVISDLDGKITLVSYKTRVVTLDPDTGWIHISGLYSMTTRKHISWFLNEYNAHTAFQVYKDGYDYNFLTGEIIER